MSKIEKMFAFVTGDGDEEGIIGLKLVNAWIPLVGADMERIDSLTEQAEMVANHLGIEVRLVEFSTVKVIKTINPQGEPTGGHSGKPN